MPKESLFSIKLIAKKITQTPSFLFVLCIHKKERERESVCVWYTLNSQTLTHSVEHSTSKCKQKS